jgi:hypothetical protein
MPPIRTFQGDAEKTEQGMLNKSEHPEQQARACHFVT